MAKRLRVGTRPSALAIRQVEEIRNKLLYVPMEVVIIPTRGDKDKMASLVNEEGSNFFTYEIEQALLAGHIDAAIHSAKDLENDMPGGLMIAAVTSSLSPFECLVSRRNLPLEKLPPGARIATSSPNRKQAVLRLRPDIIVKDIRGNIDERLSQLDDNNFDALIVAHAALLRLGYQNRIAQIFPEHIIKPSPLQGRLAIQIRRGRTDLLDIFRGLNEAQ